MKVTKQILLANQAWAKELTDENPDFFTRQTAGQKPQFLWIGCSDSRVSPEQKTQSLPGRMFIHRNIANLVHDDDLNLLSVIQYAVDVLEVPNIVICGHHGCGGIRATLEGGVSGPVDRWLENARDVCRAHADELDHLPADQRLDRLVEMNVRDQLLHLARIDTVANAFAQGRDLTLHGWVYDIRDGRLKPLMEIDRHTDLGRVGRPETVLIDS
ncbi:carbonic anhydrase [Sphingomonas sp. SORGH_AS802]|jgi:carbonic anhydrase|uniref:carbonic anhydrase n=1 Tax=unclassified Sphingomonas TaxID=196159 RepID=UPI002856648F|nr:MULTISPECIES: carbonic anhydrase [unclassified Sphingomonas]MDR6127434.1 carbonic anhydrase [Sphingomonas sp. SORGH_AS_0438]MDR6133654.1 carbonic anhydrase [Sphingomonas sp. SORGH_AS_0802]